jgi:8-oxo-dGTP diphosphatase
MQNMKHPQQIRVIAAVIYSDSKFLVCKRPAHKRHGDLWEFPGGKIHDGESDLEAAERELGEELKVHVMSVGDRLFSASDPGSPFVIEFVQVQMSGKPISIEHSEIRWCTKAELSKMQFAPADTRFVNEFLLKEIQ